MSFTKISTGRFWNASGPNPSGNITIQSCYEFCNAQPETVGFNINATGSATGSCYCLMLDDLNNNELQSSDYTSYIFSDAVTTKSNDMIILVIVILLLVLFLSFSSKTSK
jgi:hypothetical protein